jgi:hypothetical protein
MENSTLDLLVGFLAGAILIAGLVMLFQGIGSFPKEK